MHAIQHFHLTRVQVLPTTAPTQGGVLLTVLGSGFPLSSANLTVVFLATHAMNGQVPPVPSCDIVSSTSTVVTCLLGPGVGSFKILVARAGFGSSDPADAVAFSFEQPRIMGVVPTTGPRTGGTVVTLSGQNFGSVSSMLSFSTKASCRLVNLQPGVGEGVPDIIIAEMLPQAGGSFAIFDLSVALISSTGQPVFYYAPSCSGTTVETFDGSAAGEFNINAYGEGPMDLGMTCALHIRGSNGPAMLSFQTFDVAGEGTGCAGDVVRVFDGSASSCDNLMATLCGDSIPSTLVAGTVIRGNNHLFLTFQSDTRLDGHGQGFTAAYGPASCNAEGCSGHGQCNSAGDCLCDIGFEGALCQRAARVETVNPRDPVLVETPVATDVEYDQQDQVTVVSASATQISVSQWQLPRFLRVSETSFQLASTANLAPVGRFDARIPVAAVSIVPISPSLGDRHARRLGVIYSGSMATVDLTPRPLHLSSCVVQPCDIRAVRAAFSPRAPSVTGEVTTKTIASNDTPGQVVVLATVCPPVHDPDVPFPQGVEADLYKDPFAWSLGNLTGSVILARAGTHCEYVPSASGSHTPQRAQHRPAAGVAGCGDYLVLRRRRGACWPACHHRRRQPCPRQTHRHAPRAIA
mmetsp:Transcript_40393/g.94536  ORF Transcript_40393/g.94536 Transcript_40393/m.94536 type:complete len:634 (+) Transcript_40393:316-2217(+)